MVECFATGFGCGERDRQLLLRLVLTNEFGEPLRAQLQINCVVVIDLTGRDEALGLRALGGRAVQVEFIFVCEVH